MKKSKGALVLRLFLTFLEIGAFTFGGGYAMIPLIQHAVVEKHRWITDAELLDIIAIAESTPGVIAVNSATFVGYKVAGVPGSLAATLGVALPSFFIILILSYFITAYSDNRWVASAFSGIRAGVVVLIMNAVIKLKKSCPKDAFAYLLMAAAFLLSAALSINSIYILIAAAISGIVYSLALGKKKGGELK